MTGQTPPAHRTDDIRRTLDTFTGSSPVKTAITTGIVASSVALLLRSFEIDATVDTLCGTVVFWCVALFTIEISLRMLGQRVGFLGKAGNVATLLIVGTALTTPFDAVLMLRLFPLLKDGVLGYRLPRPLAQPLMLLWCIACISAGARDFVMIEGGTCAGWVDCVSVAYQFAAP